MPSKRFPGGSVDMCGFSVETSPGLVETDVDNGAGKGCGIPETQGFRVLIHKIRETVGFNSVVSITPVVFWCHFVLERGLCLDEHHDCGRS